jgi:hypothetical protein
MHQEFDTRAGMGSGRSDRRLDPGDLGGYVTGADNLRIRAFNALASVVVEVRGRLLRDDGVVVPIERTLTPATDRTASTAVARLADGWLLSLRVVVTGAAPIRGQTFVVLELVQGLTGEVTVTRTLLADYVTATYGPAFPGSPIRSPVEGPGALRSITGTDPAAGAEISETVPTGARWRPLAMQFTLVTGITGTAQEVALVVDDGTAVYARVPVGTTQGASLTRRYAFFHSAPRNTLSQDVTFNAPLPHVVLPAGHRLRTVTNDLGADDDYGAPQLLVEEWLEPA